LDGAVFDIGGKAALPETLAEVFAPNADALVDSVGVKLNWFVPEVAVPVDLFPIPPNGLLVPLNAENGLFEVELSVVLVPNEANGLLDEDFAPND